MRSLKGRLGLAGLCAVLLAATAASAAVVSAQGYASDRTSACTEAKQIAAAKASGPVTGYGSCSCSDRGPDAPSHARWTCSVEAYF